jgi:hypothetical protein
MPSYVYASQASCCGRLVALLLAPPSLLAQSSSGAPPVVRSAYGEKLKICGLSNVGKISMVRFFVARSPAAKG